MQLIDLQDLTLNTPNALKTPLRIMQEMNSVLR